MAEGRPVDDLREYLRELKPQARALLVAEIERGRLRGTAFPGADLVLQELRPVLRTAREQPSRIDNPVRLFFRPLDPFIVDGRFDFAVPGRVHRSSLMPVWTWLCRDLVPEPARCYSDGVAAALLAHDHATAHDLVAAFQDLAAGAMRDVLEARRDEREQRRLAAQIGIPRALEEVATIQHLLADREQLARVAEQLPHFIPDLAGGQLAGVLRVLGAQADSGTAMLLSSLVLVKNRLKSFWQLARVGVHSAESDAAARVAKAPLGSALTVVFGDFRCLNEELRRALKEKRLAIAVRFVVAMHEAVRALRTEIDFSADSPPSREFGALRAEVSDLLTAEIKDAPGLLRRVLRLGGADGGAAGAKLDPELVSELENRIDLLAACRLSASELALNQVAPRLHGEMEKALDSATERLLESLRTARGAERELRQAQVAAAVKFAAKLFGPEHALQLTKAAALAGLDRNAAAAKA